MADAVTDKPAAEQQPWVAEQCVAALAHLEKLQEQLDGLRSTMPALMAPLLRPNVSKAQMFAEVRKTAVQSTNDLKTFRENWTSEQTQQILARSKESLEKDGDLSKANVVARYGWNQQ